MSDYPPNGPTGPTGSTGPNGYEPSSLAQERAARRAAASASAKPSAAVLRRRRLVVAIVGVVVLIGAVTFGARIVEKLTGPPNYAGVGEGEVVFEIASGETGEDIAKNLVEAEVVASFDAFYQILLDNPDVALTPGVFKLAKHMSAQAAFEALQDPKNRIENTVLIREGETQADAFAVISENLDIAVSDLEALAANPQQFGLPGEAKSLEGFLFPATYTFSPGVGAEEVIRTLVNRSFKALDAAGVEPALRWDVIRMASLVQKEARLSDDFYKAARVFYNRLDPAIWPSLLLQSDATVAYGTGNTHRVQTTDAERADASNPWNTYVHPGLVWAPISNPGDIAIDAAIHPADGEWVFFVTWNLETGETIFSKNQAEHQAGVAKWREWMAAHPEYD